MITEHVRKKHGGNSFKRPAAYVVAARDNGRGHPIDWKLAGYVIDAKGEGEKVGHIRISNCASIDPGWAIAECVAIRRSLPRGIASQLG